MENKLYGDSYCVFMTEPVSGTGTGRAQGRMARLPPERGNIKREIFASIAAPILASLKRMGTILAKSIHSSSNTCGPEKVHPEDLKRGR
jgi:hypothetical protein